ncbi:MAG: aminotransferase class V-fold PLP-dependent enzyme, partial [Planctomycetota bacterium]|nr:aminotransferase class V-fold PLP-dependent enzyme [Planctomycetota bacterium]
METIRDDFPILNRPLADGTPLVYLDSASSAQKPQVVIDALSDCYERYYANAHRGVYQF